MSIKSISPVSIDYKNLYERKTEQKSEQSNVTSGSKLMKALELSASVITGRLLAGKPKETPASVNQEQIPEVKEEIPQNPEEDMFDFVPPKRHENIIVKEEKLKSGVIKKDKIKSDAMGGTMIETTLTPSVNGISKIEIYKFVNGDLSKVRTFDEEGNQVKEVLYNHKYVLRKKPNSIVITDDKGKTTIIHFDFLRHNPEQVKAVTIKSPDGQVKTTVLENKLKDKIKDTFIGIRNKVH